MKPTVAALRRTLRKQADPRKKKILESFFKTGPGQYAEGDVFLGVTVPKSRQTVRQYAALEPAGIRILLRSPIHEERLVGFLLLVERFQKGDEKIQKSVFEEYLRFTHRANNWDLVDQTADKIAGAYLDKRPKTTLYKLVRSPLLWERRIAIVATLYFIRRGKFKDTLALAEKLMDDPHDLMHKACGWMLREVGKRDRGVLERFLRRHCRTMPRTMLRYAIEHFSKSKRQDYLLGRL